MRILLNGEPRELAGPCTVQALLEHLGLDARVVAVEVDRAIVRRAQHARAVVHDGAEVEIVSFVGGGAGLRLSGDRPVR
jgi:thiamine biosynthesis protein ThiS